ncbi:MAG: hypothetical protein PHO53_07215, partial [Actinomycetota bacterium]|nr:hypothetical protein [Actinomycetota bacterium]
MKRLSFLMAVFIVLAVGIPALVIVGSGWEAHGATGSWKVDLNATSGFGDSKNSGASPFAVYNNKLYIGVANESGCQVFERGSSSWKSVSSPGLGNSKNLAIGKMAVYNNKLYVGTGNASMGSMSGGISSEGCELYSYDGTNWKKVADKGFGNTNNVAVTSMAVFGGKLYIGVANIKVSVTMGIPPSVSVSSEWESIFSCDGSTLQPVASGGFGDKENIGVTALAPFGGKLYAGTARAQVSVKVLDILKGESKITLTSKGCELRRLEGSSWKKIAGDGITDTRNLAITTMCNYGGKLLIGTMNGDGSATVVMNLTDIEASQISDFKYQTNGFFIYSFDGSTPAEMVANGVEGDEGFAALSIKPITMSGKEFLLASIGTTSGVARLLTYNGESWYKGADDGFGNEKNTAFTDICVFGGSAFVGTANIEGCEVWRGLPPTAPPPAATWYLAEGSTDWGYQAYISVINPNKEAINIEVTYQTRDGGKPGGTFPMAPQSQLTINPAEKIGATDFSTKVECKEGKTIAVDRTMTWVGPGAPSEEAHTSVGVTSPATTWYLPEGSASWG